MRSREMMMWRCVFTTCASWSRGMLYTRDGEVTLGSINNVLVLICAAYFCARHGFVFCLNFAICAYRRFDQ